MLRLIDTLKNTHKFFVHHIFYSLVLSSMLALGFFAGRVIWSQNWMYRFLVWNLFLAWLPYLFSLLAAKIHRHRPRWWWAIIFPGVLWLLFFPNASYIVTDFFNLKPHTTIPLWYDIGLIVSFAWAGFFLAIASLRAMQRIVSDYLGGILSWLFVIGATSLTGFGIYLGRILRWNSWDAFTHPLRLLRDIYAPIRHPIRNREAIAFTIMFAALLFVFYLTFYTLHPVKESDNHVS